MELIFTRFLPGDLAEYASWFSEADGARRPQLDADWRAYVMNGWAVRDETGVLVAVVEAGGDVSRGYVSVTVAPERRGQGIGGEAIRLFHSGPGSHFAVLEGRIAPDNAASISMIQKAGFVLISPEPDGDGLLRFEHRR
jgi:RimJ/RimL family protein N-acetyltransferase